LGVQFATLGAKQQAKNAQSWPQFFLALTPSVKQALVSHLFALDPFNGVFSSPNNFDAPLGSLKVELPKSMLTT
jgi:hypothetical protein